MQLDYTIDKNQYKTTLCNNKESPDIFKALSKLYSDKKMLIVIDKKLNKQFKKYLFKDLKLCGLKLEVLKVNASKKNKNEKFLFKIINKLIKSKFTKKSVLLSCGGGVIGDVSALASSLYLRGLIYFHIPTTMTSIVDSCLGGKTGINYKGIINSLGNYYHAKNVFISKNVIKLIPAREYFAGIPEIIKCGLIDNQKILKIVKKDSNKIISRDFKTLSKLISLSLKTKIKFFKNDVYENSTRLNLNFGHTFAHAIEMALEGREKEFIRHGEAVGIGILCEIFYTEKYSKNFKNVCSLLKIYNLPTCLNDLRIKKNQKLEKAIFNNIFLDKKKISKYPRIIKIKNNRKPNIFEMRDNNKIKNTIRKVIFKTN